MITSISPFTFALRLSTEDIDPVFSAVANAEPLTLQEGRLASSDVKSIQSAVDDYFAFRQESFSSTHTVFPLEKAEIASITAKSAAFERNESLREFWRQEEVDITSIENEASILSACKDPTTGTAYLKVYEWTWVHYNNGDGPDAPSTDEMGFATIHQLISAQSKNGRYEIVSDIYDESDVSGYTTPGYISPVEEDITEDSIQITSSTATSSTVNTNGMPFVWNAILYADQWVKHDLSSTPEAQPAYYNMTYGYFDADCANYVSQCLKNSGFVFDPSDTASRDASATDQFWHKMNGSSIPSVCSTPWRRVTGMVSYWHNAKNYSYVTINSSKSNVYPGNPVMLLNQSHVAICVGYNSAGKPIINGHTRDVFHQVLPNNYEKTLLINTSNRLSTTPANATAVNGFPYTYSNQYLASEACKWYKFTAPFSGASYRIHTTGSSTVMRILCKETSPGSSGNNMAMYPVQTVNGSNNFTMTTGSLAAGTYYLMVKHVASSISGSYGIVFEKL